MNPPVGLRTLLLFAAVSGAGLLHRQCSRPACADRAVVSLTYEYGRSHVWLDELHPDRDPHAYDLCHRHATGLSVPLGWKLSDRRHVFPSRL